MVEMNIFCKLGWHKWQPIEKTSWTEFINKWQIYEHAEGQCTRCDAYCDDIRKDIDEKSTIR